MALINGGYASAGDSAALARGVGDQVGFTVTFPRFVHGLAGNLAGTIELDVTHITGRHGADFVDDVHQYVGAVGRQALSGYRVISQDFLAGIHRLHECGRVLDVAYALGAPDRDCLDVLGRHDRADAGTAGSAMQIVHDCRVQAAILGAAADGGNTQQRILVFFVQPLIRRPHRLAPDLLRGDYINLLIFDINVNGLRRFAFKNNHIVACGFQFRADETAGI